jgi:threonine synthase
MRQCQSCGFETEIVAMRCPECGGFYSKIIELIEQEVADEESRSFKGRYQRVLKAVDKRHALKLELETFNSGLTLKAKFTLWLIFAFVFALVVTVL